MAVQTDPELYVSQAPCSDLPIHDGHLYYEPV
jgi:hypothetical protein